MLIPGGAGGVNAAGYHSGEDYIYAIAQTLNQNGYVVRIGRDGTVERVLSGVSITATTSSITSGTIDSSGFFWVAWTNGQQYAKINLQFGSADYGKVVETTSTGLFTAFNGNGQYYVVSDWAFLGGATRAGKIFMVAGQPKGNSVFDSHLLSWATDTKTWTRLATYTGLAGGTGPAWTNPDGSANTGAGVAQWGAMYPTNDGYLFATENNSGKIYKFNVDSPSSTGYQEVASGPQGGSNDGARCAIV